MSKQEQVNKVMEMLNANRKSKGGTRTRTHVTYTVVAPADVSGVVLAPQAIALVGILLAECDGRTVNEPELQEIIQNNSEGLSKKQEPWKIFQYYRKQLIDSGFISMSK